MTMTPNTIPTVYVDKRANHRYLANAKAVIRRTKPSLPSRLTVYTKDLTSSGACFLVTDSIVWSAGDEILSVFVIELDKTTVQRSKLIRLHWRHGRVIWSANGRIGVQFLRDLDGKTWTR